MLRLIENGASFHLKKYLEQPDENFRSVAALVRDIEVEGETSLQERLKSALAVLTPEDLEPVEAESQRVLVLVEGRGPDSCPPVLNRHLDSQQYEAWESQPDHFARALWLHVLHRRAFDDAVAFRNAREWREMEKQFSALEIDLETEQVFYGEDVPQEALLQAIQTKLGLSQRCGVSVIDLPQNKDHPASVMLIVRHAGRLSSVAEHPEDGSRKLHYYLPQDEVVLIYTPSLQRIDVCGQTAEVRSVVANSFARVALDHDISNKPLTWANYNTSHFLRTLALEAPDVPGFLIERATITELELRLGKWEHRVRLRVPFRDDMTRLVEDALGQRRALRRSLGISRVTIAVGFSRKGKDATEILEFTITDRNRCNLNGNRDRELRHLGRKLLEHWGVILPFRDIEPDEVATFTPILAEIFDLAEDTLPARFFEQRGIDPRRLEEAGLLVRQGAEPILIEDFDPDLDQTPPETRAIYRVKFAWLEERLISALQEQIEARGKVQISKDLIRIGTANFSERSVPCYLCKGLTDIARYIDLDGKLRLSSENIPGIVFIGHDAGWRHIGPHIIVPILKNGDLHSPGKLLDRNEIEVAYRSGLEAALGSEVVSLEDVTGGQFALRVPGQTPLLIDGAHQKRCVRLLVDAFRSGHIGVETSKLIDGTSSKSVGQLFGKRWSAINPKYIRNVSRKIWSLNAN